MSRRLEVLPTRTAVEDRVAIELLDAIESALAARGHADIVVTGGTVGIGVLAAVSRSPRASAVDWARVHVWWGDERFVPAEHLERNERQAREALFSHIDIPNTNLHPFPADHGQTLNDARDEFLAEHVDGFPEFDVVLNGIGPDGHAASLFPGLPHGEGKDIIAVENSPKPPAQRLSFTFDALNRGLRVWIVASGADKAAAVARILADSPESETPATALSGVVETVVWVDADAASAISG
jgi:6-phosphogluconolactonase